MRIKEQGFNNYSTPRHDAFGNYMDHNGIRTYTVTTPIRDGDTFDPDVVPYGAMARTTHQDGREQIFMATSVGDTWQSIFNPEVGAVAAYGYYDFEGGDDIIAAVARLFNGTSFSWVVTPTTAVQAQLVTETETTGNTVLGENLYNMVQKLNASVVGGVSAATYSTNQTAGGKDGTRINIVYDTPGVAGNAYTLGTANDAYGTRSGATLTGGTDAT